MMARPKLSNVRAILAARQGRGFRSRWIVAGRPHAVSYVARGAGFAIGAALYWPARDLDGSDIRRGACLTRHRAMVKGEIRAIIAESDQ